MAEANSSVSRGRVPTEATSNTVFTDATGSNRVSNDTATDAVAEATMFELDPSSEETEYDPDLFSKQRADHETTVKMGQMTSDLPQSIADHELIDDKYIFPEELKYDSLEILVLNADTDENEAMFMKEGIEKNVSFCGGLKPVITLLKDVIPINKGAEPLDDAFKRTIYVMLYVTEEFCKQYENLHQGHACLRRALNSRDEHWAIIPVHTSPKNKRKYELPLMLDGLRPLNLFSKSFYDDVRNLLKHKSDVILSRRYTLDKKREQYKVEYHEQFEKLRYLSKGINNSPTHVSMSAGESQTRRTIIAQEPVHRPSQQRTKNIAAFQQQEQQQQDSHPQQQQQHPHTQQQHPHTQQQQQMNPYTPLRPETSCIRLKRLVSDHFLSLTTDSPPSTEICEEPSKKDISTDYSKQLGLPNDVDCSKDYCSSTVKSPIVTYNSLGEPADDKAVPDDPTPNAFTAAESKVSHSHSNFSTGQRKFNEGVQAGEDNTVPNISETPPGKNERVFPDNPGHDVPRNSNSKSKLPKITSTRSPSQIHIHIHQAQNVVVGGRTKINYQLPTRNEDTAESEDSEDSENGPSFEI